MQHGHFEADAFADHLCLKGLFSVLLGSARLKREAMPYRFLAFSLCLQLGTASAEKDLSDESINANDLGRRFWLGELYDANTDEPIGGSLWPLSMLDDPRFVRETPAASSSYGLTYSDSIKEKMDLLGIDGSFGFERAVGLTKMALSGSAKYLESKADSNLEAATSVLQSPETCSDG